MRLEPAGTVKQGPDLAARPLLRLSQLPLSHQRRAASRANQSKSLIHHVMWRVGLLFRLDPGWGLFRKRLSIILFTSLQIRIAWRGMTDVTLPVI